MLDPITATLHRVEDPEEIQLKSGKTIKKWVITLENGSGLLTYTYKLAAALREYIGSEFTFDIEEGPFDGAMPKITRVLRQGEVFWQPAPKPGDAPKPSWGSSGPTTQSAPAVSQNGAGAPQGSWVDTTHPMNVRTALMSATDLVSRRVTDSSTKEELQGLAELVQEITMDYAALLDQLWHSPPKRMETRPTEEAPIGPPIL